MPSFCSSSMEPLVFCSAEANSALPPCSTQSASASTFSPSADRSDSVTTTVR